jgi:uncharacterized protein (TIGR02466 family)
MNSPRPSSNISSMFAVPVYQAFHPEPDALNIDLRDLFLLRERDKANYGNLSPSLRQQDGVFESEFSLFTWPEDCIQSLRNFCWSELGKAIMDLNSYSPEEMQRLKIYSDSWFHITRHGGFVINHIHSMASWSGVYCVSPGKSSETKPESGVLRFHNPHFYSNVFLDAGNQRLRPPYHHGTWSYHLQTGQLLLFPSWLPHEVLPFYGEDERITVAFNCWFGMK